MIKIYTNYWTRQHYDADGNLFENGMPFIFFGNTETVAWQLCTDTPELAGTTDTPETVWAKYTGYANVAAIGAYLTADSNFTQRLQGTLAGDIAAGNVSSIQLTVSGATRANIPTTGFINIFTPDGDYEALEYTSRSISNEVVTFTLLDGMTVENSYNDGAEADVGESVYMQASLNNQESDIANGLFVFSINAYSEKLRQEIVYSNVREVPVMGLELAVFNTWQSSISTIDRFMVETFNIRSGIAEVAQGAQLTETRESEVVTLVNTMLAAGFELQFSISGTGTSDWSSTQESGANYFRFRSRGAGGVWSSAIHLANGTNGTDGINGTDGTNSYVYIGYAADSSGSSFSTSASTSLPYINFLVSGTEIQSLSASNFDADSWIKYIGENGTSGTNGVSASVSVGTVTTLPPGSNATVTNVGNSTAAIFNFAIPRGSDGANGTGGGSTISFGTSTPKALAASGSTGSENKAARADHIHPNTGLVTTGMLASTLGQYVPASQKGSANGVASLGADGKVPASQLPEASVTSAIQITASLPPAGSANLGQYMLLNTDDKIYKCTLVSDTSGITVVRESPDYPEAWGTDNYIMLDKSLTGINRTWWKDGIVNPETGWQIYYQTGHSSNYWVIQRWPSDNDVEWFATASTDSNPWDEGLAWRTPSHWNGDVTLSQSTVTSYSWHDITTGWGSTGNSNA